MLIDVRPILHIPGKELNFQFELDLSDMEFGGRNPISQSMSMSAKQRPKWPVVRSGMMGVRLSHIWRIAVSSTYRSLPHIACT